MRQKYGTSKEKRFKTDGVVVSLCFKYDSYFVTLQNNKGQYVYVYPSAEDIEATRGHYNSAYRAANKLYNDMTLKRSLDTLNRDWVKEK